MSVAIKGIEPKRVWEYFAEISKIPRCSKNEAKISKYVVDKAKKLGLEAETDKLGNVVVRKPGSKGHKRAASICLQGHLDMVCEKNKDTKHDFTKDPIKIVRDGNLLKADGTTLGADNGIAIAMSLAIMEDKKLEHGPLEFLFTVDEETGLIGASSLGNDFLVSKTMINVDSEEEGALYVGCAGGEDTLGIWKAAYDPAPKTAMVAELKVTGLRGGHSGLEIHTGRGNAVKIINRVLMGLADLGARVARIDGGDKHNAIPREADARVFIPEDSMKDAKALVKKFNKTIKAELKTVEKDLAITLEELPNVRRGKVFKRALQKKILRTISAMPHGVIKMSADIEDLVETSTNLAAIKTTPKAVRIATSQRSSVDSEIIEICQTVASIFDLGGAEVEEGGGYPGWKPNLRSKILRVAKSTYKKLYGENPEVKAIHAGLECGIIGAKYPGMDMVSLGPNLADVHSPDERIEIESVKNVWEYLLAILKNAAK
ncbi:MAG: aminoacyl-histidine dipeptidase [Candidatus Latescibacterota bacterium]|nr:MAG: aminoacyl-histidine dipeptidase [Candidatus Latescibacterota bacterium]